MTTLLLVLAGAGGLVGLVLGLFYVLLTWVVPLDDDDDAEAED